MQLHMTTKEKVVYGFIAVAITFMVIEHRYELVGIATDISEFAVNRISGHEVKHAASTAPRMTVAKARNTKSSSPGSGSYTVQPGETLFAINRKYDGKVDIKATCALNALGPECKTTAGQSINLAMRQ